jgi:hypothetical protein
MKIDFASAIKTLDGKAIITKEPGEADREFTLRDVCVNALLIENQEAAKLDGAAKVKRFRLADKIYGTKEPIALASEDIVLLKGLIASSYGPLVTARAFDLLEPPAAE